MKSPCLFFAHFDISVNICYTLTEKLCPSFSYRTFGIYAETSDSSFDNRKHIEYNINRLNAVGFVNLSDTNSQIWFTGVINSL